jgi:thiaminase/transcriptional activator TenA
MARTPRRMDVKQLAVSEGLVDKNPPPADSFAWTLWLDSQDIAQEALATKYIQGIGSGTLDPNAYGIYNVHDAVYCFYAEGDYRRAETRAKKAGEAEIATFCQVRYQSYEKYRTETFAAWGLQDAKAVEPGDAVHQYVEVEHTVAEKAPPIYLVAAMIPCDQLWPWLADQIAPKSPPNNVYEFWITENNSWSGAYVLDNFVDRWNGEHPGELDFDKAKAVYRACMTGEVNCFRAVVGEPLLPMPPLPSF